MHFEFRPELHEINRLLALQSAGGDPADSPAVPDLHHIFPGDLPPPKKAGLVERILRFLNPALLAYRPFRIRAYPAGGAGIWPTP
jgi:hypothetical protein